MTHIKQKLAACLLAVASLVGVGVATDINTGTTPVADAYNNTFERICWPVSSDWQLDQQLCRQGFEWDLNRYGGITVNWCSSVTVWGPWGRYAKATCNVNY